MKLPATIEWESHTVHGTVTDLSHAGLFIECDPQPEFATALVVHIEATDTPVTLTGVVRWNGERGVGVQFREVSELEREALARFIARRP